MSTFSKNAPTLVTDVRSKVQRLVSYIDDTVVSDDEMGTATGANDVPMRSSDNGMTSSALARKSSGSNNSSGGGSNNNNNNNSNATLQSPKRRGEFISDFDEEDEEMEEDEEEAEEEEEEEEDAWGVRIPPEPPGQCSIELQEKIGKLYRKMEAGLDMNAHIQQRKDFRNPSIYEKLIQFCSINEMGTNYPPDRFDPFKWGKDSYYEELARVQKTEMDKLEKARKEKTKIEIVTGTAKRPSGSSSSGGGGGGGGAGGGGRNASNHEDDAKRRKSKWDQVATCASTAAKSSVVVSQPTLATTLTSSATGTKATVISAFGSLPKKRL